MKSGETRFSCEDGPSAELPISVFGPAIHVPSTWGSAIHWFGVEPEADFELVPRLIGRKGNRLSFAGRGGSNGKLKSIHFGWTLDLLGQIKGSDLLRYAHLGCLCIQNWHSRLQPSPHLPVLQRHWGSFLVLGLRLFWKAWNNGLQVGNVYVYPLKTFYDV